MIYERGERLLTINNLCLNFGSTTVLRDLSAEIDDYRQPGGPVRGQVVAFLAPSGMGKTQLFRCIAGLQRPSSGEILVQNAAVHPGDVGVVAQDYPLLETRTVLGNLNVVSQDRAKILGLLNEFDLHSVRNHYPCQLSGGQRQRVAVLQQVLCSRHFLLMDEPFSGLDPLAKNRVAELILQVANADELNTVIITSHDIRTALAVSDLVWLLGRDRDATGQPILGAKIQKTYDLKALDLCWNPEITKTPRFLEFVAAVERDFESL